MDTSKWYSISFYYKNIFKHINKIHFSIFFLVFVLIIQNTIYLLSPIVLEPFFDNMLGKKDFYWFLLSCLAIFLGWSLLAASYVLSDFLSTKIGLSLSSKLRLAFYKQIQEMPLGMLQTLSAKKLLTSFSEDIAIVYDSTIFSLWQSLSALFFIPIGMGILFYLNWQLTLLVVFLIPITMLISQFYFKKANKTTETKKGDDAKFFAFVQQDIATQLSIRRQIPSSSPAAFCFKRARAAIELSMVP